MSGAIAGHVEQIFIDNMKDIEVTPDEYAPALFWAVSSYLKQPVLLLNFL